MQRFDQLDAVAVLWWSREDYARMLEIMADAHRLPPSFEDWLQRAQEAVAMIADQGGRPTRCRPG